MGVCRGNHYPICGGQIIDARRGRQTPIPTTRALTRDTTREDGKGGTAQQNTLWGEICALNAGFALTRGVLVSRKLCCSVYHGSSANMGAAGRLASFGG